MQGPSERALARHRRVGPRPVLAVPARRARLAHRRRSSAGSRRRCIGAVVGICAGYFGGWVDRGLTFLDDWFLVIPFVPFAVLMAALLQDDARQIPGRQDRHHRARARDHRLGGDDAHRARAGALAARAPVRRARALAGRLARLDHAPPHPAQRDADRVGQLRADRRALGARRGRASRTSASATRTRSPGARCSTTASRPARSTRARGGTSCRPGARDHALRARVLRHRPGHRGRRRTRSARTSR